MAPRVSTVGSLRIIARLRAIACTPKDRIIEIIAGNPSGTEATARLIRANNSSLTGRSRRIKAKTNKNAIITRIRMKIALPRRSICCSRGVRVASTADIIWLIWPSSVSPPLAITTPFAVPALIVVPENSRFLRSPITDSFSMTSICFSTTVDSPVRIASSIWRLWASSKRKSAGILSPGFNVTISPGTKSCASMVFALPSRMTTALLESMFCMLFSDFSALFS
ncbi:Uncharacterised protein [Yersinia enterocolitica]|nr:Uncharacterised protein [Yersinia enterocolitica]